MTLYIELKNKAQRCPKQKAIFYCNKYFTYKSFLHRVDSYAYILKNDLHLHRTTCISLCLRNSIISLALIYACNKLGIICNFINPHLTSDQIIYFDSMSPSRLLFMSKKKYLQNIELFRNVKNKIVLIDDSKIDLELIKLSLKKSKHLKDGLPVKLSHTCLDSIIDSTETVTNNFVAIMAPNEDFYGKPLLACFDNKCLESASSNQATFYKNFPKDSMLLSDGSMMSMTYFLSFYHVPLINGICLNISDIYNEKDLVKCLKNTRITNFCGAIDTYRKMFLMKTSIFDKFIKHVDSFYVLNDSQRTYLFDLWQKKCNQIFIAKSLYSVFAMVETCGMYMTGKIEEYDIHNFGEFVDGYEPLIINNLNKDSIGTLRLMSNNIMISYYKQPNISDSVIDEKLGLLTKLQGRLDINNNFYLATAPYNSHPYNCNDLYVNNIKDMLLTIPGIHSVDLRTSLFNKNTIDLFLESDGKDDERITRDVKEYLETQIKMKNLTYTINYKK